MTFVAVASLELCGHAPVSNKQANTLTPVIHLVLRISTSPIPTASILGSLSCGPLPHRPPLPHRLRNALPGSGAHPPRAGGAFPGGTAVLRSRAFAVLCPSLSGRSSDSGTALGTDTTRNTRYGLNLGRRPTRLMCRPPGFHCCGYPGSGSCAHPPTTTNPC